MILDPVPVQATALKLSIALNDQDTATTNPTGASFTSGTVVTLAATPACAASVASGHGFFLHAQYAP